MEKNSKINNCIINDKIKECKLINGKKKKSRKKMKRYEQKNGGD